MSLARTALRIAAIGALKADPTIAALCPNRIYDSLIDALDARDPVPVIVIYTEDDDGNAFSANNGGAPFRRVVDLLVEISMRVVVPDLSGMPDNSIVIGLAETDAEAEIAIDLLEDRAIFALTLAPTPESRLMRDVVVRKMGKAKSVRFSSSETGAKIALRTLTLSVEMKNPEPDDAFDPPMGDFVVLPEPLRTVAAAQLPGSSAAKTCLAIAARISRPAEAVLEGIDMTFAPRVLEAVDPAHPPAAADHVESFGAVIDLSESAP